MCTFFFFRPGGHECLYGARKIQTSRVSAGHQRPFHSKFNENDYIQHPLDELQDLQHINVDLKDGGNDDQPPSSYNDIKGAHWSNPMAIEMIKFSLSNIEGQPPRKHWEDSYLESDSSNLLFTASTISRGTSCSISSIPCLPSIRAM